MDAMGTSKTSTVAIVPTSCAQKQVTRVQECTRKTTSTTTPTTMSPGQIVDKPLQNLFKD